MAALIGWLDDVPVFQYEVVRHKISLQCRGGGRGVGGERTRGAESHGKSILSYDFPNSAVL